MDTENSTNLYLQTCQTFLTCNYHEPQSFEDLYKLLPWLRQSLSCCICSNVLKNPMSSTQSHCQHFICKECKGGKMVLKPSCSWCKDQDSFQLNEQLVILIGCFKKICELIYQSPIYKCIKEYDNKCKSQLSVEKQEEENENDIPVKKKSWKRRGRRAIQSKIQNISVSKVLEDALNIQ